VIVPTEKVRDLLLVYNVEQPKSIVPTGIELKKFSENNKKCPKVQNLRVNLGIAEKDKVLLYIGDRCLDGVLQNDVNGYAFYEKDDFIQFIVRILNSESKKSV